MQIVQDITHSVRSLRKNPGLTFTAIAALALGIGATTVLFTVVRAVLLQPANYPDAKNIVELNRRFPGADIWSTSATKFDFWKRESNSFSAMAALNYRPVGVNLSSVGAPEQLSAFQVSAGFFRVLGVQPLLGRSFTETEDKNGAGRFVVLSYPLWQRLFGGDSKAIGRSLELSGASYTVLGVMPKGFDFQGHPQMWIPLQLKIDPADLANIYRVIARLKPGVSLSDAQLNMNVVAERFRGFYKSNLMNEQESIRVLAYQNFLTRDVRSTLWILMTAVGFVLLIACANVANLLLARSTQRQQELAVRMALGASARQLVQHFLTESLVLSAGGAAIGIWLAYLVLPSVVRLAPTELPELGSIQMNTPVVAFAAVVSCVSGILFGLLPAWQSYRLGRGNPLLDAGRRTTAHMGARRARHVLVIGEVAVSLVLLAGAALMIQTMRELGIVKPGFDAENVLTMGMSLNNERFQSSAEIAKLTRQVTQRLESVPEIVSVANSTLLPLDPKMDLPFEIVGPPSSGQNMPDERVRVVSAHYFSLLRIPIISGRGFSDEDTHDSAPVLVVNDAFVRQYFPDRSPIGAQVLIGRIMGPKFADRPRQIVGVVGDTHDRGLDQPSPPMLFEPITQIPDGVAQFYVGLMPLHWLVRTSHDPESFAPVIRREAVVASGGVPMASPILLDRIVGDSIARQRFMMTLLGIFAGIALALGAIGLYGVLSYSVVQRSRELGIRSALGAERLDLLRLVVGQGMKLTAWGLSIGLVASLGLTRALQKMLYGVTPADPLVLITVSAILAAVALAACWIPAHRATRIDPIIALRED
jgi:predicted permease